MNVLFAAAEVAPLIKTGGLADVAGALPAALRRAGHDVRVVMPYFRELRERGIPVEGPIAASFVTVGERQEELRVWRLAGSETPVYLLDIPAAFERSAIYGEGDDDRRFILFARGVLALMQHLREVERWQVNVVHSHDWHAALIANYLKTYLAYTFGHVATVFTIHNLAYQGQRSTKTLALAGLTEGGLPEDGMGPGIAGTFNFMARGILFNDVVTTVSPTYAQEIMTPEYGERLDGLLRAKRDRVVGILNGIDREAFDPSTDAQLAATFDVDDLSGKAVCKTALQEEFGLPVAPDRPLLGIVSRLVEQKGLDLLDQVMPWILQRTDAQLVILGSGNAHLQFVMQQHARAHPHRIAVRIGFDAALAQRIYAGSDAFLMPSRFEPCGLGQMIALRYGSVPIVRATGGLNDTVREGFDGNGFRFHPYEAQHFADAIARALQVYRDPESWALLRARGMREDNSWDFAAQQYGGVYDWAARLARR
ncbi:glycogen synthase [Gemmatimonas groenlandica]|uniref:Glycogen synthase n=1 Tax=Gemmatimonas groenlandica TaxID=2732249 RepID=A0A6M4IUV2_9BACT|nr:glycogen synthase [Gemmatimonas groenlandica]QJR37347.1 glycogen synthase [Gemmatimonas groenlandica]